MSYFRSVELISTLERKFEQNSNPEFAENMSKYMKGQFEFYGLKQEPRRKLVKESFREIKLPQIEDLSLLVHEMYARPEREWHYSAVDLVRHFKKKLRREELELIEWMCCNNSWWDTVDGISLWVAGPFLLRFQEFIPERTDEWIEAEDFWLQRMAILFQIGYKEELDFELMCKYILRRSASKEFFIQKASGWILRQQSRRIPKQIENFVIGHPELASLTKREALRLIKKKS